LPPDLIYSRSRVNDIYEYIAGIRLRRFVIGQFNDNDFGGVLKDFEGKTIEADLPFFFTVLLKINE
ncbi:MAG: hypothetical protein L0Y76_13495, partial [Ignavibacteria bacterium]|nr:hypothetical protein [Ignavibacteria bacterium]